MTTPRAPLFTLRHIPAGDTGAGDTLLAMRQLVETDLGDAGLVQEARRMVAAPSRAPDDIVEGIRDVLTRRMRYRADPPLMEYLQSPGQLLAQLAVGGMAYGDCDDTAMLAAYLGAAHGLPYRFRAVGFTRNGALEHVFTLLRAGPEWVTLDTTRSPNQPSPVARRGLELGGS